MILALELIYIVNGNSLKILIWHNERYIWIARTPVPCTAIVYVKKRNQLEKLMVWVIPIRWDKRGFYHISLHSAIAPGLIIGTCYDRPRMLIGLIPCWRHQMETFPRYWPLCAVNPPVTGEFPSQRPVTRSFDVFFHIRLNKRLSKQSWGWWFETLSRTLWRHYNDTLSFWCHIPGVYNARWLFYLTNAYQWAISAFNLSLSIQNWHQHKSKHTYCNRACFVLNGFAKGAIY